MPKKVTPYRLVVSALSVLLAMVTFGNSWGEVVTDIKPEVYLAPGSMVLNYLSPWSSTPYLGHPNFNVGLTPVVVALTPLTWLGLSPEWVFKVTHFCLWFVAAWGASRLLRGITPTASKWAGLATGVIYVASPYAIVGGSTLAVLLPLALLPWMVLALVRSLEQPSSWRWPAAFGIAFFAMSGMNVGIVPVFQLLVVPPVAVVVGRARGRSWREILGVVSKCAVFVLGVSLYWLVPSFSAARTGAIVVSESETIEGIAGVSSLVEVLRGMGMWILYGNGAEGPWVPEFAPYVSNPLMVLATLMWPVLALLALRGADVVLRRLAAALIATVSVVMVGFFPGRVSTPLAWVVEQAFILANPLLAFRTTNKAGAALLLAFALLLGAAVPRWTTALPRIRGVRPLVVVSVVGLLGAWSLPALAGNLYISPITVPGYWQDAANAVDERSHTSRTLFLPSQIRASYRWTPERADDLSNALMRREAIIPQTSPSASLHGANFLAALGDLTATNAVGKETISTMSRYLGAGDILLRHDVKWEESGGARPADLAMRLAEDPGLLGRANYGEPGENVLGPAGGPVFETVLPPVQHYEVLDPLPSVSARDITGELIVAGDAWAHDEMARNGITTHAPVVTYAASLEATQLAERLGRVGRLVLTDTNRRQPAIPNRLNAGYGPLRPADVPLETSRALGAAEDQTVLVRSGPQVTASQTGSAFFDTPYGQPDNILDGDPSTSWLFGDFDRAEGATLDVQWPDAQDLGVVSIRSTSLGGKRIDQVTMSAGDSSHTIVIPAHGVAEADFTGVSSDDFSLRIDRVTGPGFGLVGVAELGLPAANVTRVARLPRSLDRLYSALDDKAQRSFAALPFDVLMRRAVSGPSAYGDEETGLWRDFVLPTAREFDGSGRIRLQENAETAFDRLVGVPESIEASSSSHLFDNPDVRASRAIDGDPETGWVPGGDPDGAWWQVSTPARAIPEVRVVQSASSEVRSFRFASRVAIEVDGRRVAEAELGDGENIIPLPAGTEGQTVRMVILGVDGSDAAFPPRFTLIDTGIVVEPSPTAQCVSVGTLDDGPVLMRPTSLTDLGLSRTGGTRWEGCDTITLGAGSHEVRPAPGFIIDSLSLIDRVRPESAATQGNQVTSVNGWPVDRRVQLSAGADLVALKIGQSYDPRWRATADGVDLGTPLIIDGWSTGWILDGSKAEDLHIWFGPHRTAMWALAASVAVLAVGAGLWIRAFTRRRERGPAVISGPGVPSVPPAWVPPVAVGASATAAFGLAGAVGAGLFIAGRRRWPAKSAAGIPLGAALVAFGGVWQVLSSRAQWGTVNPSVPAASMWPHWLAVVGLVIAVSAALWSDDSPAAGTQKGEADAG